MNEEIIPGPQFEQDQLPVLPARINQWLEGHRVVQCVMDAVPQILLLLRWPEVLFFSTSFDVLLSCSLMTTEDFSSHPFIHDNKRSNLRNNVTMSTAGETKQDTEPTSRQILRSARRVCVKAGTSVVANENGRPSLTRLGAIAEQIAELKRRVAAGDQKTLVARDFGISRETLYQYLRED